MISSNDKTNFTYRGRFHDVGEAYTISYEASQKIHNALKWLIERQGVKVGDKEFVLSLEDIIFALSPLFLILEG